MGQDLENVKLPAQPQTVHPKPETFESDWTGIESHPYDPKGPSAEILVHIYGGINIGALIIRMGFCGPFYYNYKEPPK